MCQEWLNEIPKESEFSGLYRTLGLPGWRRVSRKRWPAPGRSSWCCQASHSRQGHQVCGWVVHSLAWVPGTSPSGPLCLVPRKNLHSLRWLLRFVPRSRAPDDGDDDAGRFRSADHLAGSPSSPCRPALPEQPRSRSKRMNESGQRGEF